MPMYAYSCDKCKKIFELVIPLEHYDKDVDCKYCAEKLRKIFTPCFISRVPGGLQNHHS
jgi:putative FmdB family regulatory protein